MKQTCNKVGYEDKKAALTDIKIIKADTGRRNKTTMNGRKLIPYECKFCGKWHLTSQKQHKKRIQRRVLGLKGNL